MKRFILKLQKRFIYCPHYLYWNVISDFNFYVICLSNILLFYLTYKYILESKYQMKWFFKFSYFLILRNYFCSESTRDLWRLMSSGWNKNSEIILVWKNPRMFIQMKRSSNPDSVFNYVQVEWPWKFCPFSLNFSFLMEMIPTSHICHGN